MVGLLPPDQTLAFSLLQGNMESGTFTAKDGDKLVTLSVRQNKGQVSLDMKNAPKAEFTISVMVRLCCRGTTAPVEDISSDKVSPEIIESAKEFLTEHIQVLWDIAKESGCDLFNLKRSLYRSSVKKYAEWKDFLLSTVTPEIKTEVTSLQ